MSRVLLVVLVALLLVPLEAEAGKRRFERFRWPKGSVIIVENRMGHAWNESVEATVASWDAATPHLRFRVQHRTGGCRYRKGRIVLCRVKRAAWVGYGNFTYDGRAITAGLVKINDTNPANRYLLCHEIGHALGLMHNDHTGASCLAYYDNATPIQAPGPFDRESLRLLYARRGPGWP